MPRNCRQIRLLLRFVSALEPAKRQITQPYCFVQNTQNMRRYGYRYQNNVAGSVLLDRQKRQNCVEKATTVTQSFADCRSKRRLRQKV